MENILNKVNGHLYSILVLLGQLFLIVVIVFLINGVVNLKVETEINKYEAKKQFPQEDYILIKKESLNKNIFENGSNEIIIKREDIKNSYIDFTNDTKKNYKIEKELLSK